MQRKKTTKQNASPWGSDYDDRKSDGNGVSHDGSDGDDHDDHERW